MLKNKARIGWVVGGLVAIAIFIVAPVYFSIHPRPDGWVGMGKSNEKSQVTTEEIGGKTTKTITTNKIEPDKTLWDWASLVLVPATLAVFGFAFQASQERAKISREKAEKEREEA